MGQGPSSHIEPSRTFRLIQSFRSACTQTFRRACSPTWYRRCDCCNMYLRYYETFVHGHFVYCDGCVPPEYFVPSKKDEDTRPLVTGRYM